MRYKVKLQLTYKGETSDTEYIINNPQLENNLICKGKGLFDKECFNYALNNPFLYCCERAYEILYDNSKQIKNGDIKENDIIVYLDEDENTNHFAKVYETDGTIKNTIIRSKWGQLGIYETTLTGIPEFYGCYIEIWRTKIRFITEKVIK